MNLGPCTDVESVPGLFSPTRESSSTTSTGARDVTPMTALKESPYFIQDNSATDKAPRRCDELGPFLPSTTENHTLIRLEVTGLLASLNAQLANVRLVKIRMEQEQVERAIWRAKDSTLNDKAEQRKLYIENRRKSGWQRERFDPRKYMELENEVDAEMGR